MASYTADQSYYTGSTAVFLGDRLSVRQAWVPVGGGGGPTLTKYYTNKVWDPGGPAWVFWETASAPDPTGASYPDPYATGFGGCSNYRVAWTEDR